MNTKFTKGEWVVAKDNTVHILSSRQKLNCRISQFVPKDRIDNSEANAKLIAAAPDLLIALQACHDALCTYGNHPIINSMVDRIIKKATS